MNWNIPEPVGHWAPRVVALIVANGWDQKTAGWFFDEPGQKIVRIIKGQRPDVPFVKKLLFLEQEFEPELELEIQKQLYNQGKLKGLYNAARRYVRKNNAKTRPADLREVGVVDRESGARRPQRILLSVVRAPAETEDTVPDNRVEEPRRRADSDRRKTTVGQGAA